MKKLLVVYYSQSGQLKRIIDSFLQPLADSGQVELFFEELQPEPPYPFPWSALTFADAFPESFEERPCRLKPLRFNPEIDYDAIILAYQVWYLAPSIPISSFLQSAEAARVLRNRPVVTLIGCRNMWLLAQEKVKTRIAGHNGTPAGNIVLMDRAPNLLGVISIAAWLLTGHKERFLKIFPKPGISDEDIASAGRFGSELLSTLNSGDFDQLQARLNEKGGATVVPSYILFEQRISKVFRIWAKFIRTKGGPTNPARKLRLRCFIGYLLCAVFLIAPLATAITYVLQKIRPGRLNERVDYYLQNRFKFPTEEKQR